MTINIPREVETALDILHRNNFEAYIVGGCVRDSVLGMSPSDWDITTSARPEDILLSFRDYKTIETGIKHGTVTVIIHGREIEVTSYRIDGEYSDNRRPDHVLFTDNIDLDLMRRDFTINALAYNKNGMIDLFGGIDDIKNKVIRCVGNPYERFNEDGLRILRALRFASVLNFHIEEKTSQSIHENRYLLKNISMERINVEFNKLIMGRSFQRTVIDYRTIIEVFLPDLKIFTYDELEYRLKAMASLETLILRLSALLYKVSDVENLLIRLKYSNAIVKSVKILTSNIDEKIYPDPVNVKKWLHKVDYVNLKNLIKIKKALFEGQGGNLSQVERIMDELIEREECYSLDRLAINGQDLLDMGLPKGRDIGRILNRLLNDVIEGKLDNEREELVHSAQKYLKKLQ